MLNSITITDLKPHRNYTFTVVVRSGTESSILRRSLPVSAIFTTKESVPGKVEKFEPIDIQPSDIIFEWTLPSTEANGVIQKFTITYGIEVRFFYYYFMFLMWTLLIRVQSRLRTLFDTDSFIY